MEKIVKEHEDKWRKICNKWVKDMKWIKVVKRHRQKEHLKQGDEQNKFIYYNKTYIDTLKNIANSINEIIVCVYVWVCVCVCV